MKTNTASSYTSKWGSSLNQHIHMSNDNPVALRFRIWYFLAIHFVNRGCEFHHQLSIRSLKFEKDKNGNGIEYVTISHEIHNYHNIIDTKITKGVRRNQWGSKLQNDVCHWNTRQVQSLKLFLSKTNPNALSLFNECNKGAVHDENQMNHVTITQTQKVYLIYARPLQKMLEQ